jgi:phage terminase small subunit
MPKPEIVHKDGYDFQKALSESKKNMDKPLNNKQEAFCREYMIDMNATAAYIRAGYKEVGAGTNAGRMIKNDHIIARLAELAIERCDKNDITAQMVLDGIKEIATDKDARDGDKLKAWELLGKYLKLFTDRVEVDVAKDCSFTMVVHQPKQD